MSNSANTWRSVSRTDRAITASSAGVDARSIVNDIIVEMELGGDKATLMAMLDKVGEV